MMCWGSLLPRSRSESSIPDRHCNSTAEIEVPVATQPHQSDTLQDLLLAENLSPEGSSSISVIRSANDDEFLPANAAMPSRPSPSALDVYLALKRELTKMLKAARTQCKDNKTFIITPSELDRLISPSDIEREIRYEFPNMPTDQMRAYAKNIEKNKKKMFGIYALLNPGGTSIRFLLDVDLCDKDLPLIKDGDPIRWSLLKRDHDKKDPAFDKKVQAFDKWENDRVEEFDLYQWWMIAPFFDHNNRDCLQLKDDTILPFIPIPEPERKRDNGIPHEKVGGYGEVTAYRIQPEYHNFPKWDKTLPQESQPRIAVKRLLSNDRVEYLKERSILYALAHFNHPHLIHLLATYLHNKSYHLIFPCADANLRVYWSDHPEPDFNHETAFWSIQQIAGIADGLYQIHKFEVQEHYEIEPDLFTPNSGKKLKLLAGEEKYGRHGDIKAENLLWFSDENLVKITDFGLGRFHGRDSRSRVPWNTVTNPLTYEPPECTLGCNVSRRYDIWSMGCLLLEWVTWLLQGNDRVYEFSEARGKEGVVNEINDDNFFTASGPAWQKSAEVRDSVIKWVRGLHATDKCSDCLHDLLDFVMARMLIVDPDKRTTAEEWRDFVKKLVSRAKVDGDYLVAPAPRLTQISNAKTYP